MSDDGRHVFFYTAEDLVQDDVNGVLDVYEYVDGRVRLVTSGHEDAPSYLADATPDGRDVFFTTRESLTGWDADQAQDLYVARTDGEPFPEPEASTSTPCEGSDCQGEATPAPPPVSAGSVTSDGPARSARPRPARLAVSPMKAAAGTRMALRARVTVGGRIRVSGPGVRPAQRRAGKAGAYRLLVRLSASATRSLERRGRLSVNVTVRFTPVAGRSQAVRVRLTFKAGKEGR